MADDRAGHVPAMATPSAITSAIATAQSLGITYANLRDLLRQAIASGLTDDGRVVVSTSSRGTSISFGSLTEAVNALKAIDELAQSEAGIFSSPGSFVPEGPQGFVVG